MCTNDKVQIKIRKQTCGHQGKGGMGTGIPKYQAVAAARIPTTGAAATIPPYLDKPPHLNIRFCHLTEM